MQMNIEKEEENYTITTIGKLEEIKNYCFEHPLMKTKMNGKLFVGERLHTTSMEISFQSLAPGKEIPFNHSHKLHEEVYYVLKGKGRFIIDRTISEVTEGSLVRIAPKAKRRWLNPYEEELIVMVIQAVDQSLSTYTVFDGYKTE